MAAAGAGSGGAGGTRGGSRGGGARKLRPWLVAQVESGAFPGLVWDDEERRALRIPWRHGGKGGARGGAGTALCRAWAEYKGRVSPGSRPDPAGWKTRLRCALNKSPEFQELPHRSRPDGPQPYKVYRLVGGLAGGETPTHSSPTHSSPPASPRPQHRDSAPARPCLRVAVDSAEPLPPVQGGASLCLRLWLWGSLSWQGWLPPGEYLLSSPPPKNTPSPPPCLLPRLLLLPPTPSEGEGGVGEAPPPALEGLLEGLRPGLLLASAGGGVFLRRRRRHDGGGGGEGGAGGGVGVHCRAPHFQPQGGGSALPEGELVLAFDPRRFQEEAERHRQGAGPYPQHRVTLALGKEEEELGPQDGPHNRCLVLQLEQAMAQPLLDSLGPPPHGTQA